MGGALLLLALLPLEGWLRRWGGLHPRQWINFGENPLSHRSGQRRHMLLVNLLGAVFLLLGFVGSQPVAEPYVTAGLLLTLAYFLLLLLLPLGGLRLWRSGGSGADIRRNGLSLRPLGRSGAAGSS